MNEVIEIFFDILDGIGKEYIKTAEKSARNIEKEIKYKAKKQGRPVLYSEQKKLDEIHNKIDNAKNAWSKVGEEYHSRLKRPNYEENSNYISESNEDDNIYQFKDDNSLGNTVVKISDIELKDRIKQQIESASKSYEFNDGDIVIREEDWQSLGLLKEVDISNLTENIAGLLRLRLDKKIIYVSRVIEINSGGFRKKVCDVRELKCINNLNIKKEIIKNFDKLSIEILSIGGEDKDIDFARCLEKSIIKYYKI